eukprot:scaffold244869_cov35-Tisochrysis_lutea.AAC.1
MTLPSRSGTTYDTGGCDTPAPASCRGLKGTRFQLIEGVGAGRGGREGPDCWEVRSRAIGGLDSYDLRVGQLHPSSWTVMNRVGGWESGG